MSRKRMMTKVEYEFNGKKDVLYYGSATIESDKILRLNNMKQQGYKILNISEVEHI